MSAARKQYIAHVQEQLKGIHDAGTYKTEV